MQKTKDENLPTAMKVTVSAFSYMFAELLPSVKTSPASLVTPL